MYNIIFLKFFVYYHVKSFFSLFVIILIFYSISSSNFFIQNAEILLLMDAQQMSSSSFLIYHQNPLFMNNLYNSCQTYLLIKILTIFIFIAQMANPSIYHLLKKPHSFATSLIFHYLQLTHLTYIFILFYFQLNQNVDLLQ